MRLRLLVAGLLLFAVAAGAQTRPKPFTPPKSKPVVTPAPAAPAPQRKATEFINGVADTGQFLPDDAELARVDDKVIRVGEYISAYFSSYPEYRPRPDSLGRIDFLNSMINKEVLGRAARAINRPLGFEDRLTMRSHTERVLSNILFLRLVSDSIRVTPADIERVHGYMKFELRLRHIVFTDMESAHKVRADLAARRITWEQAFRKYHRGAAAPAGGVLGWTAFTNLPPVLGLAIFSVPVGDVPEPTLDEEGIHLIQAMETRPARGVVPELNTMRTMIRAQITNAHTAVLSERVQSVLRARAGVEYDSAAIRSFATRFRASNVDVAHDASGAPQLSVNGEVPEFSPADTARVLARWKDGRLTLEGLLHRWTEISPLARPALNTFEAMRAQIDAIALEPYSAVYATELGLDKDSLAIAQIERRREEILVKHMFADSIESRTWISRADRRKYYDEHPGLFTTYPAVEFAAFSAHRRSEADSLAARLRAGVNAAQILHEDSLAGVHRGSIQQRSQNDNGPWHKVLFEEMRPGTVRLEGPDHVGDWLVLQLRHFDAGHLLPYEQVEGLVDESLQNIRQEEALQALLGRLKARHRITTYPERLMLVKLVDPTLNN